MLLRAGYAYVPYASMESVIEENKELYYKALRRTQTTIKTDDADWLPWVGFFLRCLKKQKDKLIARLDRERITGGDEDLPELSVRVMALLRQSNRQTIAQLAEATGASKNTLKVRLRELVDQGRIQRHGKARATWYSL
jgi:Fic family protein